MNIAVLTVILLLFLTIVSFLTYLGYRQTKSQEDYAVAGRQANPWMMALSYGSTFISTSAIVGFGGAASVFGFGLLWLAFLNSFVGIFIAFLFLGDPLRRMSYNLGTTSLASFLGERYQSKFITWFAGLMIFGLMPAYTGVVIIGGARFLEESLKISFGTGILLIAVIIGLYVGYGGLKGIMYSDAFMGSIMLLGMIFLLFTTYSVVGGVINGHEALTSMANLVPDNLKKGGHLGWTSMPKFGAPVWWTLVSTIVMGVGIGVLAQPQLLLRFMTIKDRKAVNRSLIAGGVFLFFMTGTAFMVGPLTNVYFYKTTGQVAIAAAKGNSDSVIPMFINAVMPEWFVYLFMMTLLAAAITTVNGLIHVQSVAFSRDLLQTWGFKGNPLVMSRVGVAIGTIAAVILAFTLPTSIIARATAFWFGICAAGLLPALLGALFWKKGTKAAAAWSVGLGYITAIFGYVFMHESEAKPFGICKAIFGKDTLFAYPWTYVDPLFYSIVVSALVFIIVSLASSPLSREHLEQCFAGMGRKKAGEPGAGIKA